MLATEGVPLALLPLSLPQHWAMQIGFLDPWIPALLGTALAEGYS